MVMELNHEDIRWRDNNGFKRMGSVIVEIAPVTNRTCSLILTIQKDERLWAVTVRNVYVKCNC
jgi:hypothetical protein